MVKIFGWIPKPSADPRGSGKTGGMTWRLHQKKLQGRRVLANYETAFLDDTVNADIMARAGDDPEIQSFLGNSVIALTEVHQFLESRRTQKTDQLRVTYGILQLRKLRSELHWDSQADHQVEKRLMEQTDFLIHCENLGCGEMECREQSCGIDTCGIFHYEMYHRRRAVYLGEWWLNGPKDFYDLFDSEAISMDFFTPPSDQPKSGSRRKT